MSLNDRCEILLKVRWWVNFVFCNIVDFDLSELHGACNQRSTCVTNVDIWVCLERRWFWIWCSSAGFIKFASRRNNVVWVEHCIMRQTVL